VVQRGANAIKIHFRGAVGKWPGIFRALAIPRRPVLRQRARAVPGCRGTCPATRTRARTPSATCRAILLSNNSLRMCRFLAR